MWEKNEGFFKDPPVAEGEDFPFFRYQGSPPRALTQLGMGIVWCGAPVLQATVSHMWDEDLRLFGDS